MGYITKDYLITQFTNFATRISTVFAKKTELPTKVSDLTNDSGFITNTVDNLTNYYTTANTYTKSEVDNLIVRINNWSVKKVDALPSVGEANTIYLVPKSSSSTNNSCIEYIWTSTGWEQIGDTQISVDLSDYLTKTDAESTYLKKTDIENSNIDFSTYFS